MPAICEIREACETFEEARRLGEPELKSRRVELTEEELALVNEKEKWGDLGCNTREEYEACLAELGITEEENEEAAV